MVAAPGMLLITGKTVKERRVLPVPYLCDLRHATVTRQIKQASSKKGTAAASFLYNFSLSYLDRPSTGAVLEMFEHFVFLYLALVCRAFCFLFLLIQLPYD